MGGYIMENYNEYLMISDEIKLNKLASELDIILTFNEMQMHNYTEDTCMNKMTELYKLFNQLMILKQEAIMHNNYKVYDYCEVYLVEAKCQMSELRKLYMKETN
jgi:hypothetical protein